MTIDIRDFIHDEDAANIEKLRYYMDNQKIDCKAILENSQLWSVPTEDLLKRAYIESVELMKYTIMLIFRNGFIDPESDPLTRQSTCIMTDEIRISTSNLNYALHGLCYDALPVASQIDDAHSEAIQETCYSSWKEKKGSVPSPETADRNNAEMQPYASDPTLNDPSSVIDDSLPKEFYANLLKELWETVIEIGSAEVKRDIEARERMARRFKR